MRPHNRKTSKKSKKDLIVKPSYAELRNRIIGSVRLVDDPEKIIERALEKNVLGEDFDKETGLSHMAHVSWNAMALLSYIKFAPEKDDRFIKNRIK